tara:strand:+ start:240 stop:629 length:390 start_codon:yes stop_codon:yes gene_type:complete
MKMKIQNKVVLMLSLIGIISLFLPWFNFFRPIYLYEFDGSPEFFYTFLLSFIIIGILQTVVSRIKFLLDKYKMITIIVIGLPMLAFLFTISSMVSEGNFELFKIGFFLCFISGILILLSTIFHEKIFVR